MRPPDEVIKAAEDIVAEIREDRDPGRLGEVTSFSDLHQFVDANEYGGFTEHRADWSTEDLVRVQEIVDGWLRKRWLIIEGNPVDGLTFLGPYLDEQDAVKDAEHRCEGDWWVSELVTP